MTIPIKLEPPELSTKCGMYESCYFCKKKTKTWNENTNNPVCSDCSKMHKVSELPDNGKRIRAKKRKGLRQWNR